MNNANESIDSNKSGRREKQIRAHKVTADWERGREREREVELIAA